MIRESLQHRLITAAGRTGFGDKTEYLFAEARECIYLLFDSEADAKRVGCSRLGGSPDLPEDFNWPAGMDQSDAPRGLADFLLQLNLSEVPNIEGNPLPRNGYIWLFVQRFHIGLPRIVIVHRPDLQQEQLVPQIVPKADLTYGDLTEGCSAIRFKLGISLPFGRKLFERALGLKSYSGWIELKEAIEPDESFGRVGGYAFSSEGHHYQQTVGLTHLNRRGLVYPHNYESIGEFNAALLEGPRWQVKNQEEIDVWRQKTESMRSNIEWLEEHKNEICEWQFLLKLRSSFEVDLYWGGVAESLWAFARGSDLANVDFRFLAAEIGP